jgi:prepilin-type N-terminal cleavage/methylation domain-containing protein
MNTTKKPTSSSAARRAFTLIEILVVVVIIAILIGLVLPAIKRSYLKGQILTEKLNLQAIVTALNNYKTDFRDYPRNGFAMTDIPSSSYPFPDPYCPDQPHTDPSLAIALIGPGPAQVVLSNGNWNNYNNGDPDGADGPGFKSGLAVYQATTVTGPVIVGATSIKIAFNVQVPANNLISSPPLFTVVSIGGPGSPDGSIPVKSYSGTTINLAVPVQGTLVPGSTTPQGYLTGTTVSLLAPAGRTWGPYLAPEKFKVAYVLPKEAYETQPLPVLLDDWGTPILYYPAYNTYTNHVDTSTTSLNKGVFQTAIPAGATASVGPLFGVPSVNEVTTPPSYSYNTAVNATKNTGPAVFWSGPLFYFNPGQVAGILYRLGDVNGYNAIVPSQGETFNLDQPFFLISAGPDGQFSDLYSGASSPAPNSQEAWLTIIKNSDDVYSFDQ